MNNVKPSNFWGSHHFKSAFLVRVVGLEPTRWKALDPKSSLATNYNTPAFAAPKVWIFDGIAKKCVGDYGDTAAPCPTERGLGER